jgi:hypothetical protein
MHPCPEAEIAAPATVLPAERLLAARRRRFLAQAARDLRIAEGNLRIMLGAVRDIEARLRRIARMFRCVGLRHDAYSALIARCQDALLSTDPNRMAELRDGIVREHAILRASPFLAPGGCRPR